MLLERAAESEDIHHALADGRSGNGTVITVDGPPGTGKTTLIQMAAKAAVRSGYTLLSATGSRLERDAAMGLVSQLLDSAHLSDEVAGRVFALLDDTMVTAMLGDLNDDAAERINTRSFRNLTAVLLELAERTPLLIAVDNAQFADTASMRYLNHLAHRIDRAPVVLMVGATTGFQRSAPVLADLRHLPNVYDLRLGLISPAGAAEFVAEAFGIPGADAGAWHQISGGNPLLLNALACDHRSRRRSAHRPGDDPVPGDAFARAVLTCLQRGEQAMLSVAHALAVLDCPASPALLDKLVGDRAVVPVHGLESAGRAGILHDGRFRHPRSAAAVLESMDPGLRAELHRRAACALHREGAPVLTVARHQLAARRADTPWSVPLLRKAAEQALDQDDVGLALDLLCLSEQSDDDYAERVRVESAMFRARVRVDPNTAERYVPALMKTARDGRLPAASRALLVNHLIRFGRPEEAAGVLLTSARTAADTPAAEAALDALCARLAYLYPDTADRLRLPPDAARSAPDAVGPPRLSIADLTETAHRGGFTDDLVSEALAVLYQHPLDEFTYESLFTALEMLIYAESLDHAATWCDTLLTEATTRRTPTWRAMFSAYRAAVDLRRGDLGEAERHARAALTYLPAEGWGVYLGLPVSTLLTVLTYRGRYEQAVGLFALPIPDAMFRTPFGLQYLRARGRFHLAGKAYRAAAGNFEMCGRLMRRWGIDLPGIVPWRTDLAEARAGLGLSAESLIVEQLAMLGPSNRRTRGITLRSLAAAEDGKRRVALLREAVDDLQSSGARHELAIALSALSEAQYALGEHAGARRSRRRCRQITERLDGPSPSAPSSAGPADVDPEQVAPDEGVKDLSDAERRVAALAARGDTNQQIARKLFITLSTVEQHLTRVYRKLGVNRRADLPTCLVAATGESA